MSLAAIRISKTKAKSLWMQAQGLHEENYFGQDRSVTTKVIEHLGYVQIDTINVIERSHHHILYSRIPNYHQSFLHTAQTQDKTVFEYWTHALSYIPTKDYRFFLGRMKQNTTSPSAWFQSVKREDLNRIVRMIKNNGPISIRDIKDDVLVEKDHDWGSRKPSKKALQFAFNQGKLVISERVGMLKKYELAERHFKWGVRPKAANEDELNEYLLQRSLRSQALVSLESICHLEPSRKPKINALIEKHVKDKKLIPVCVEGSEKTLHWLSPGLLNSATTIESGLVHILSPFDPLVIQRKRLNLFFDYQHVFEAYIPKEKRVFGYFSLPVLVNDKIFSVLDLKTDRQKNRLIIQKWTWLPKMKSAEVKKMIEAELNRFEKFQLPSKST